MYRKPLWRKDIDLYEYQNLGEVDGKKIIFTWEKNDLEEKTFKVIKGPQMNNQVKVSKNNRLFLHVSLTAIVILIHFLLGIYGSQQDFTPAESKWIDVEEFRRQLIISGIFLYTAMFATWTFNILPITIKSTIGMFLLSLAISILFAADKTTEANLRKADTDKLRTLLDKAVIENSGSNGNREAMIKGIEAAYSSSYRKDFSSTIYALIIERHAIFVLLIMAIVIVSVGMYHLFRSFFALEYSGSGIQVKLPGHMIYYVPVFPQMSWQNTGIPLKEGTKYHIELSGLVSPGSIYDISNLEAHMEELIKIQKGGNPDQKDLDPPEIWPYTGPAGYEEDWYGPKKLEILKGHPLYKENYFYKRDACLTVKGLPHNKVVGMIVQDGETKPRSAKTNQVGYDWNNKEDQDQLVNLSSRNYPLNITSKKSGELWVVINDVDLARWDNSGLFFLKVTKQAWF